MRVRMQYCGVGWGKEAEKKRRGPDHLHAKTLKSVVGLVIATVGPPQAGGVVQCFMPWVGG